MQDRSDRKSSLSQAAEAIRKANSLVASCHVRPDPDALGSLLGLTLGLESLGKRVTAISPDGVPDAYAFLPGNERVVTTATGTWDVGIGMDADGAHRLGPAREIILAQPVVLDIDHHTSNDRFGAIQVVDPTAAATGELIYELLCILGVPITREIAVNLLAAILTDTGGFRFSNVSADTFRIAAALTAAGAHPHPIYEAVYGRRSFATTLLLGRLLNGAQLTPDGRLIWSSLGWSDFAEMGVDPADTEGFVDQIRMVSGTEVAIFFREDPGGDVRVSLRSMGRVDVACVARQFGGGGHRPAAGCTLSGPLQQAVDRVLSAAALAASASNGESPTDAA